MAIKFKFINISNICFTSNQTKLIKKKKEKKIFTHLKLHHLQICSNFELLYGTFLVQQYPKFAAENEKCRINRFEN